MKTFNEKISDLVGFFGVAVSAEERYERLIALGKGLVMPGVDSFDESMVVQGCQSRMLLRSELRDSRIYFEVYSEALISRGLAALLVNIYNGEEAEVVLTCAPSFIKDLGIVESLTPSRANGLGSIFLKMKQEALRNLSISH